MQGNWDSQCRYGVIEAVHEFCVSENYQIQYLTMDISESLSFAIKKSNNNLHIIKLKTFISSSLQNHVYR